MKIAAKGMIDPAYFAYGRKWPRHVQVEAEVTAAEYEAIAADKHIVSVIIAEASGDSAPVKRSKGA